MLKKPRPARLVLASTSIYRRQLLERLQLPFETHSPDIDEQALPDESPTMLVERLAFEKARAVANQLPGRDQRLLVIGSDQIAVYGNQLLGKPGTAPRAIAQLTELAGKKVKFLTALCLLDTDSALPFTALDTTYVHFRPLSAEEIARYVQLEQPFDCAGSFKSEGLGASLFTAIESKDPTALIGLPLIELCEGLRIAGYHPLDPKIHEKSESTARE